MNTEIIQPYHACRVVLGETLWKQISSSWADRIDSRSLSTVLSCHDNNSLPAFLPELARLEEACCWVNEKKETISREVDRTSANPTLEVFELSWKNLTSLLVPNPAVPEIRPVPGHERILIWYDSHANRVIARPATDEDILILKMVVEEITPESIAVQGNLPIGAVDNAFFRAKASGLIVTPPSQIRRDRAAFHNVDGIPNEYLSSPSFTLQWHITQACDLSCKHCYDRSSRTAMPLDQAIRVLDDLRAFCKSRNVVGAVSFTGGNPLLHPSFSEMYQAAAERGFSTAILGNPSSREQIEKLVAIQTPSFFQVSLEGLHEHNDDIRGQGHFERSLRFLDLLRELHVSSMVMLTLTSENIDQVLPLAEMLRGKADTFHFNRLSRVGEGENLRLPDTQQFRFFLQSYLDATRSNPVMGMKDNCINILLRDQGRAPFGGCTGYGCGAAFNFVSLLADGEVHACRKFPSPIGNIHRQSLAEIYDSKQAARYRLGSTACSSCEIRPVCGGCLAGTHSHGLNIFKDKDPFCFMQDKM